MHENNCYVIFKNLILAFAIFSLITASAKVLAQLQMTPQPKRMSNLCLGLKDHLDSGTVNPNTFEIICGNRKNDAKLFDSTITTASSQTFQVRYKEATTIRELKNRMKKEGKYNQRYMAATIEEAAMNFIDMTDSGLMEKAQVLTCDEHCAVRTEQAVQLFQRKGQRFPSFSKTTRQYTPPPDFQPEDPQFTLSPPTTTDENLRLFIQSLLGVQQHSHGIPSSAITNFPNQNSPSNEETTKANGRKDGSGQSNRPVDKNENVQNRNNPNGQSGSSHSMSSQQGLGQISSSILSGVQSMGSIVAPAPSSTTTSLPVSDADHHETHETDHHEVHETDHHEVREADSHEVHEESSSHSSSIHHSKEHARRIKKSAPKTSPTNVIGVRHVLYCNKAGSEEQFGYNNLCGNCRTLRLLPAEYFPRYINEATCSAIKCIGGGGSCMEKYINFDILHNIGNDDKPNWVNYTLPVASCCSCLMGSELADLLQISTSKS